MIGGDDERLHMRRDEFPHRGLRWAFPRRRCSAGPAWWSAPHRTRFET